MSRKITAIAHRGASSYAPENTFAAFGLAVEMGIGEIKLDVQFTSDSHIVVIHDETLDRTTDSTGPVSERTLEEIQLLDAGFGLTRNSLVKEFIHWAKYLNVIKINCDST